VARRTYSQYCPLAQGLDVIGERWALLIVRDLLLGPQRYSDLARGLPGIATDILTRRLRELEEADVVERVALPPPAAGTAYRLTERGEGLRAPLLALARWGIDLLDSPPDGSDLAPSTIANALQVFLQPGPVDRLDVAVTAGGQDFGVRVADGHARVSRGRLEGADLTLSGEPEALVALLTGDAEPNGEVVVEGDRALLERLREMIVLPARKGTVPFLAQAVS
jgi:DNA-binding HxlR family transcriptional regulator